MVVPRKKAVAFVLLEHFVLVDQRTQHRQYPGLMCHVPEHPPLWIAPQVDSASPPALKYAKLAHLADTMTKLDNRNAKPVKKEGLWNYHTL